MGRGHDLYAFQLCRNIALSFVTETPFWFRWVLSERTSADTPSRVFENVACVNALAPERHRTIHAARFRALWQ